MKQLLMAITLFAISGQFAAAQKIAPANLPKAVKTSFANQYPGITAKWEKEDGKYEAVFKQHGNVLSALYEANGTFTESEMIIPITDLPALVLDYMKAHYPGKKLKEGAIITTAAATKQYEATITGKEVIFDANGKFLKELKD
jgi:hypothetical protein